MSHGQLQALLVGDSIVEWNAIGFVGDELLHVGSTTIVAAGSGTGIVGAGIVGVSELDGLAMGSWEPQADRATSLDAKGPEHANGVTAIDHIVVMTPDCDRTTKSFESNGLEVRRVRRIELPGGARRQTFFWLGDVICEVVGPDVAEADGPAHWWGLAFVVSDLDATKHTIGDKIGSIKPAVQPGRFVASLRPDAGVSVPSLFMSAH